MIIKDLFMIAFIMTWLIIGVILAVFCDIDVEIVNLIFLGLMIIVIIAMYYNEKFNDWLNKKV